MKRIIYYVVIVSLLIFSFRSAEAATFSLDKAHTRVGFKVKHLVIATVSGQFDDFEGSFVFDEAKPELKDLNIKIKTTSINTNEPDRDKHLRGEDFFKVVQIPLMTFKSTKVEYLDKKAGKVHGILTMVGVSKPVILDVTYHGQVKDPWGNVKLAFEAFTEINRKDYGVKWNKALDHGGLAVGDVVKIIIEGEAMMVETE
jgi:polyisoprenoid-binding protein YceI